MALPQITLPTYTAHLPSSGEEVKYRPFTVREEKVLLIAVEENDPTQISDTVRNVIDTCTFGKVDARKVPKIDVEYLFVKIRNKSMGEGVDAVSKCIHCNYENYMSLNFDQIQVKYPEEELSDTIQVAENVWVKLRQPNIDSVYAFTSARDFDAVSLALAECVVKIIDGDNAVDITNFTKKEIADWLESVSDEAYEDIANFVKNTPILFFEQNFRCVSCGGENRIYMEDLESFFG